ncbi:MAG: YncE family protein [Bacteroidetes bacterium]|nr:YncE family protein [Bacteroidota bacterium]
MNKISLLIALLHLSHQCNAIEGKGYYTVAAKTSLPGNGRWDYLTLDDSSHRLFVSHGDMVQVVDVNSVKVIATIPDTKGVHGVALAHDLDKGYISCGKDNTVVVFDLNILQVLKTVPMTGINPDGILYDPYSHNVFVFNGKTSNATVMDAREDKVIGTIVLKGKPEFPATDCKGNIYVNIEDKSLLSVIGAKTLQVLNNWTIAPGTEPSGLAIDTAHHRLYTVCDNQKMIAVDYLTGKVVAQTPIGARCDGVVYDAVLQRICTANGDGTITVIDASEGKYKVLANVPTQKGARTVAISQTSHHLYLPTAEFSPAPPATKENPKPRPTVKDGTFRILDIAPDSK